MGSWQRLDLENIEAGSRDFSSVKRGDKVGEALGISGKSAEQAATVADEIERRHEEGDHEGAEHLKDTLNDRGFQPAAEEAKKDAAGKKKKKRRSTTWPPRPVVRALRAIKEYLGLYDAKQYLTLLEELEKGIKKFRKPGA